MTLNPAQIQTASTPSGDTLLATLQDSANQRHTSCVADLAAEATLSAIQAKLPAAPALDATVSAGTAAIVAGLSSIDGHVDGLEASATSIDGKLIAKATAAGAPSAFTATSSATIKAANANRKLLTIFNQGPGTLYVRNGGGTASAAANSFQLAPQQFAEMPVAQYGALDVTGIFDQAGTAMVQETT